MSAQKKKSTESLSHRVVLAAGTTLLVEQSHAVPIVSIVVAVDGSASVLIVSSAIRQIVPLSCSSR